MFFSHGRTFLERHFFSVDKFQRSPLDTVNPWLNSLGDKKSLKVVKNQQRDREREGSQAKEMLLWIRPDQKTGMTPG